MAISGGAVVPLLTGWLTDVAGITIGMFVLVACAAYILVAAITAGKVRN